MLAATILRVLSYADNFVAIKFMYTIVRRVLTLIQSVRN